MPKIKKIRIISEPPNLLSEFEQQEFRYNSSENLKLWLRFDENKQDLANNTTTSELFYVSGSTTSVEPVYLSKMDVFHATDFFRGNKHALLQYDSTNNPTSFGDGSNDSPFSLSLWIKDDVFNYPGIQHQVLIHKGRTRSSNMLDNSEWSLDLVGGGLIFGLYDADRIVGSAPYQKADSVGVITDGYPSLNDGKWHHIVITYDGRGGTTAANGMHIYIDGAEWPKINSAGSGTYVAMEKKSNHILIGASPTDVVANASTYNGAIAEVAVWSEALSSEAVAAIFHASYNVKTLSGYTNLPPRLQVRNNDNRSGCYPTKHRMGDKDRSGKANIFYEDLPIQFGNKIEDDFSIPPELFIGSDSSFDLTKWVVSTGMTIRNEVRQVEEGELQRDRCAVFSGNGTGNKRFIRTKNKIRNPYHVYFELLQGPYNLGLGRLDLRKGNDTHSIKIQIATTPSFANPTTVATINPSPNLFSFYNLPNLNQEFSKTYKFGLKDFIDPGSSYYLRIVQEVYEPSVSTWAIRNITIKYANQNIRYPINVNHADTAGNRIAEKFITTPHTSGTLTGVGMSVKGVSDVQNPFKSFEENVTPFNESLVVENAKEAFFNEGLDPEIYPDFTMPTRSKTKITVDLSVSSETTFGYTKRMSQFLGSSGTADGQNNGQQIMVYWNNKHKRWEKKGQPLGRNFISTTASENSEKKLLQMMSQSCVGFSPLSLIGTSSYIGSDFSDFTFYDESQLRLSNQPITDFGFPFSGQYLGTGSNIIKAKDIGITKPFLLEAISYDGTSKFEMPKRVGGSTPDIRTCVYLTPHVLTNTFTNGEVDKSVKSLSIITPTFFILRQFRDDFTTDIDISISSETPTNSYNVTIPGMFALESGSNDRTYVDTSRELVTYSNMRLFVSRSRSLSSDHGLGGTVTFETLLDRGLSSDLNIFIDDTKASTNQIGTVFSLTQSFCLNSRVKNSSKTPPSNVMATTINDNSAINKGVILKKQTTTRGRPGIGDSRSLVNGNSAIKIDSDANIICPTSVNTSPPLILQSPALDNIDLDSPYLILPEDNLILGWQYPLGQNLANGFPILESIGFNSMTLGNSKLHLYGSQVVDNKEYHETVNQNLTSCAVYEHIIGDEKVVDQWQVGYRGEYTGSYGRNHSFSRAGFSTIHNKGLAYEWWDAPSWLGFSQVVQTDPPTFRIGAQVVSDISSYDRINLLLDIEQAYKDIGFSDQQAEMLTKAAANYYKSAYTSIVYRDQDRLFFDDPGVPGNDGVSYPYGTLQRLGFVLTGLADIDRPRPFYSFNRDHFGHYFDMFEQGKDTRFRGLPRQGLTTGFDIFVNSSPPVRAIFVSGTYKNNSAQKVYTRERVEFLLDDFRFQSSNLSTSLTSSLPFIEDASNSKNAPANRSYDALNNPIITIPV